MATKKVKRTRVYKILAGVNRDPFLTFEYRDENMMEFLRQTMREYIVRIQFYTTETGRMQEARATLRPDLLPERAADAAQREYGRGRDSYVLTYWDVDKRGWRSARKDHIVGYYETLEDEEGEEGSPPPAPPQGSGAQTGSEQVEPWTPDNPRP